MSFPWSGVFDPHRQLPAWSVEGGSRVSVPIRAVASAMFAFWPHGFWRRIHITHALRPGRLVAYTLLQTLLLYIAFAGTQAVLTARLSPFLARPPGAASPAAAIDPVPVAIDTFVSPFSERTMQTPPGRRILPFPRHQRPSVRASRSLAWTAPAVFLALACGAAFLFLPTTFRTCRVRRSHVVRIVVYSLPLVLIPCLAAMLLDLHPLGPISSSRAVMAAVAVTLLLLWAWWTSATRSYLHLPHARSVATVAVVMATLATLVCLRVVSPDAGPYEWLFDDVVVDVLRSGE